MVFTDVPLTTVTAVPPTSTPLHGFSPAACLCTVPFGQNPRVGAVPNVPPVGRSRVGPSGLGRAAGSLSFAGYLHLVSLHRSLAVSFGSGTLGDPISSVIRYWPTAGQLKRMRIGRFALTARSRA